VAVASRSIARENTTRSQEWPVPWGGLEGIYGLLRKTSIAHIRGDDTGAGVFWSTDRKRRGISMGCTTQLRNVVVAAVTGVASLAMLATPAFAVEMFTYFGDGSHIGLPSLEVPIEAYPGIPLRSDRLRARRAGTAPPRGTIGYFRGRSRGITIRVPVQQQMPPAAGTPGQPDA